MLLGTWSLSAFGQNPSVVATARQLGQEGLSAFDAGRYDEAAQKLLNAYRAAKVPTFARNAARALVKQGKLVAASEHEHHGQKEDPHGRVARLELQQAQRDATEERAAILPRIAHLKIVLHGTTAHETEVSLDDAPVPEALLGTEQFADPGVRHVLAKRGEQTVERSVELKEGEHRELLVRFEPAIASPTRSDVAKPAAQPPAPAPNPRPQSISRNGSALRTLGWIGISVGVAGVATGAGAGIGALLKRSSLQSGDCTGDVCRSTKDQGRVDTYNALRTVSTIGFVVGGLSAAAGVTLLLTTPKRESPASVSLQLGPSTVALSGRF